MFDGVKLLDGELVEVETQKLITRFEHVAQVGPDLELFEVRGSTNINKDAFMGEGLLGSIVISFVLVSLGVQDLEFGLIIMERYNL